MAWHIHGCFGRQCQKRLGLVAVTAVASVGMTFFATADDPRAIDVQRMIERQVAFGEFAAAINAAGTVDDLKERANLLGMIANAQLKAGDASACAARQDKWINRSDRKPPDNKLGSRRSAAV